MHFVHLRAKNFQSFKELYYEYRNGIPVLILGENLTDDDQESNGSGKSVLMSGPEYCILHTMSKKVNDKDLVYWWDGSDTGEIELSIHCPLRKETLLIERKISIKNGGSSQLSINGIVKYAFVDKMVGEIDKFIIEWIGISKEDLQNYFIISKFRYISFFNASNTSLNQLIGRFSNTSIISGIDKDILLESEKIESDRLVLTEKKNRFYGMIDVYKSNLETEQKIDKEKLIEERLDAIDNEIITEGEKTLSAQTQIGIENDKIVSYKEELTTQLEKVNQANSQLRSINEKESKFDKLYSKVDLEMDSVKKSRESVLEKSNELSKNKNELWLTIQEIERNIKGSVKCPKCDFEFLVGHTDISIEEEKNSLLEANKIVSTLDKSIEDIKVTLSEFDPKIRDIKRDRLTIEAEESELRTMKRNISNSISTIESNKNTINNNILVCEGKIQRYRSDIQLSTDRSKQLLASKSEITVDTFDNSEKIKAINEEIENCNNQITSIEELDKAYSDKIFDIKQWAFTFKEFQQYLSTKTIKVLQGYANKTLSDIKSDLRIQLEGYRMKTDGTLSDKITAYIVRDSEIKEFGNFSGGEKARLESAMIIAVQTAVNSTNKYGGLNFLSMDEVQESIDGLGITTLVNSFIPLNRTILLTTHIAHRNYDCEVLKVIKEDKISRLS